MHKKYLDILNHFRQIWQTDRQTDCHYHNTCHTLLWCTANESQVHTYSELINCESIEFSRMWYSCRVDQHINWSQLSYSLQ